MILRELSYGDEEEEVLMKYGLQIAFESACHFEETEIISEILRNRYSCLLFISSDLI